MGLSQIRAVDYVVLLCRRLPQTRAFYRDVMGFPIEYDSDTWVSFRVGSTLLTLKPRWPSQDWDEGPIIPGSASVQLAFRVPPSAVDACHAELVGKGAEIVQAPTDLPVFRHRALFFRDPEQNVLEIYAEY